MSSFVQVLTSPWHLAARFVTSLPPTPPSVEDEVWAEDHLLGGERALWVQLSNQDRRHSIGVAQRFDDEREAPAGFAELEHYFRPAGLPREQQAWLASAWRAL